MSADIEVYVADTERETTAYGERHAAATLETTSTAPRGLAKHHG